MAVGENTQVGKAQLDDELLGSQVLVSFDAPTGGETGYVTIHAASALEIDSVQCKTTAGTAEVSIEINASATPVDFDPDDTGVITAEGWLEVGVTKEGYTASGGTSFGGDENLVSDGDSITVTVQNASAAGTVLVEVLVRYQRAPA